MEGFVETKFDRVVVRGAWPALERERAEAERKAIDALARYKFQMFGYWAAIWVHLNRLCPVPAPNPFRTLVIDARRIKAGRKEAA